MHKRPFESPKKRHLRELNNARCNRYYHKHKKDKKTTIWPKTEPLKTPSEPPTTYAGEATEFL